MSVDSISSASPTTYAVNQRAKKSSNSQGEPPKTSPLNSIEDPIETSPYGRTNHSVRGIQEYTGGVRYIGKDEGMNSTFVNSQKIIKSHALYKQHAEERARFDLARKDEFLALQNKLIEASGGLLNGAAYHSDDLSKPITTTSGSPHPLAEQIRAFLKNHQQELNQLMSLSHDSFPSFEDWKAEG